MSQTQIIPQHGASSFTERFARWRDRDGATPATQFLVFALVLLALFTRRPDAFLRAQFYAEDGRVWFAQAYALGWLRPLFLPSAGTIQTLPRLVAGLLLPLPLHWVPLGMNIAGAIVQALPVPVLLSRRCSTWGPLPLRVLMAITYVVIPDASEIHVVVTNAMWHLVVLQLLLAFALPPATRLGRTFDVAVFTLGVLTGPFCIFMFFPLALYTWLHPSRRNLLLSVLMVVGSIIQAIAIHGAVRSPGMSLGPTPARLLRILAGDIFIDSMVGPNFRRGGPNYALPLLAIALIAALAVIIWGCRKASLPLSLYAAFCVLTLAASLKDPAIMGPAPRWALLIADPICRYWFYPSLLFLWSAAWCAWQGESRLMRLGGCAVMALLLIGTVRSWRYPAWPDNHFSSYAQQFEQAKPGQTVVFPVYPNVDWTMTLTKR